MAGDWLATTAQWAAYEGRIKKVRYWLIDQVGHVVLGYIAAAWFPPLWAWILYREVKQAIPPDREQRRPSQTTGWLDPLTDFAFYVVGATIGTVHRAIS